MRKFKFKFKKYIYFVIAAAIILSFACVGLNLYRLISGRVEGTNGYIGIGVTFVICALILVLTVSMAFSSYYSVDDRYFTLSWGVLKNRILISDITDAIYNAELKKLTVVFSEGNFMVISVEGVDPLDVVDALRAKNKKIMFEYLSTDPSKKDKNGR